MEDRINNDDIIIINHYSCYWSSYSYWVYNYWNWIICYIIKDLAYKYEVDEQQTIHIIQQVDYIRTVNPQFNKPVLTMVLEAGFDFGE